MTFSALKLCFIREIFNSGEDWLGVQSFAVLSFEEVSNQAVL